MSPDKALELVGRYARLTRLIKVKKAEIGDHLEKCKGISGVRGVMNPDGYSYVKEPKFDEKNRDTDLHLWLWYTPEYVGDGYYTEERRVWEKPTAEDHGIDCPHCYAAHLAIQERKQARKQLAAVRGAMSRSVA